MTRDQALSLLNQLPLIEHFAKGGTVAIPIKGRMHQTDTLVLSNFRSDRPANYAIVKPHYRFCNATQQFKEQP